MNRRKALKANAFIGAASLLSYCNKKFYGKDSNESSLAKMPLGIIASGNNPEEDIKKVHEMGFTTCQLSVTNFSEELAVSLRLSLEKYNISPTTLICMGPEPYIWNLLDGPNTIGFVPREHRKVRQKRLQQGIKFCQQVGIPAVHAHFGFIPENPRDILYSEFIDIMKEMANYGLERGVELRFETGQETPITLLRTFNDIASKNLSINFDPANFSMYGKGNVVDALELLGKYVKSLHAKDGISVTEPNKLGKEVPIPKGEVDFPRIIRILKEINFEGHITIECEMDNRNPDYYQKTIKYLEDLIRTI